MSYLLGAVMKANIKIFLLCILGVTVILSGSVSWADITGSISGVITDPSGAVIPGANVTAIATSTNIQRTTVTDSKGFYSFPALSVDHYDVSARLAGFRDFLDKNITIDANSQVRVDIKMQLGNVADTVTVQSDSLQVETESTQLGDLIQGSQIASMPLDGRSYIDLMALQPGVSPYQGTSTDVIGIGGAGVSGGLTNGTQSVNGSRVTGNGFMVNGADAEEGVLNGAAIIPNLDSIAQFRILTSNFNAEYGNFGGGLINVVTKSGTNEFHGDLFNFLRNTDLDARNYYAPTRGVYIQNQFGGTIGGPIRKNKIFWFADYQGTRQIIGATQNFAVPSMADRSGMLADQASRLESSAPANGGTGVNGTYWAGLLSSQLGYPVTAGEPYYTAGCSNTATCVFPNAIIPQSAISPAAQNMMKYIPQPNIVESGSPFYATSGFNETLSDDKAGIRVDANTRYGSLFGYYFIDKFDSVNPYWTGNVPGFSSSNLGTAQMANLGLTTTFNSSTVNDIRLVYLRNINLLGTPMAGQGLGVSLASLGFNTPWGPTGGFAGTTPQVDGVPTMNFNNYSFGVSSRVERQYNNTFQILDNFSKVIGTHSLQFGTDLHYDQIAERSFYSTGGGFNLGGQETGFDFADFLIGAPNFFSQGTEVLLDTRSKYYSVYAQDSWRATQTLTVNYGLRWEVSMPWYDSTNKLETLIPGEQSLTFPNAPTGIVFPLDPGVPRTLAPTQYKNFAPRIGIAYAPNVTDGFLHKLLGGSGQTSIRAGFGLFYTAIEDETSFLEGGDTPYGYGYGSTGPILLTSPYIIRATGALQPNYFPFTFPPKNVSPQHPDANFPWASVLPIAGAEYFYPHNVLPYAEQFQISLQRSLGPATVATVSYVGTAGRQLLTFLESNPGNQALCLALSNPANVAPGSATCGPFGEQGVYTQANGQVVNSTRPVFGTSFGSNPYMKTMASSSYNSLQASLRYNQKYGNFLIAYTYAKSIDNGSGTLDATNPYNPSLSRALSLFNVPQDLTASYTINLPFDQLGWNSDWGKRVTGGWAVSGIATFASGQPVQLSENDDRSLSGTSSDSIDVPSYAGGGAKLFVNKNPRSGQPYFNPNYFVPEPLGQVGDVMRRFFSGPGLLNFDTALLKNTQITEGTQLQFRAETFNTFNHTQFNNPSGLFNNTGVGGFGYVTSAQSPRIMQIALKLLF
jgi:Carboxypeptidase regulatory-like domain